MQPEREEHLVKCFFEAYANGPLRSARIPHTRPAGALFGDATRAKETCLRALLLQLGCDVTL